MVLTREGAALGEALVDPSALGLDLPPVAEAAFSAAMSHHDSAARKVGGHGARLPAAQSVQVQISACVSIAESLCLCGDMGSG